MSQGADSTTLSSTHFFLLSAGDCQVDPLRSGQAKGGADVRLGAKLIGWERLQQEGARRWRRKQMNGGDTGLPHRQGASFGRETGLDCRQDLARNRLWEGSPGGLRQGEPSDLAGERPEWAKKNETNPGLNASLLVDKCITEGSSTRKRGGSRGDTFKV